MADCKPNNERPKTLKNGTMLRRARKNIQSRTLDSRFGRKSISAVGLGPHENAIIQTMKDAITLHRDHEYAKMAKKTVLKTALKLRALAEMNVLDPESVAPAVGPFNSLALALMFRFDRACSGGIDEKLEMSSLVEYFENVKQVTVKILKDIMTPKNVDLIAELISYIGSADFGTVFFYDPEFFQFRDAVYEHMKILLQPWLDAHRPEIPCQKYGCEKLCCTVYYGSSKYCTSHHEQMVEEEMKNPTLEIWMKDTEKNRILQEFFLNLDSPTSRALAAKREEKENLKNASAAESKENLETEESEKKSEKVIKKEKSSSKKDKQKTMKKEKQKHILGNDLFFLRAVEDYEQLENKNTLKSRAQIIYKKYLATKALKHVHVGRDTYKELRHNLDNDITSNMFKAAQSDVLNRLRKLFHKKFMYSDAYRNYWKLMQVTQSVEN